ncbi:DUF6923 family protein, partial [Streptomyces sp. NPDC057545]|uniref:DUF6923 family protein n=1 Tax=Streptomyces sp. NPDC057545 TaxID=3346164 RepID=UPI0036A892F8
SDRASGSAGCPRRTPLLTAPASHAAAGDAFDPADPTVFVAQEVPTRLYKAITDASGSVTFQPEGTARAGLNYNAISYNTADNYLYGVVSGYLAAHRDAITPVDCAEVAAPSASATAADLAHVG